MSEATETFQMLGRRFFVAKLRAHKTRTDTIVIIMHEEARRIPCGSTGMRLQIMPKS